MAMIGINMPVRLVALAEGALTGFTDEAFDVPHVVAAHDLFIDIPGRGDRAPRRARAPLRDLPRRPVQGALARGDAGPVLQHAVRHLAAGRDRPQGGQEPPLVPRALLHAARRLRPLGRALRRRHRRLLPGAAHRRHRQHRHDLLLGRRVPRGRARARLQRRRGRLPAERGRADDELGLRAGRHVAAPEPRPCPLQHRLHAVPERRARLPPPADEAPVRHRGRQLARRRLPGQRDLLLARRATTRSSPGSSTSRRCASSGS